MPPRSSPAPSALPDLPITAVLDDVVAMLATPGSAGVLVAPPGTGKTTVVPLALAEAFTGRVVVAEPRRVATRAAARRMAALLGEQVGGTVGYSVRGERRVSDRTRIEVVTSGLLVRRVQHDAELAGVSVVLLDECHERHLDADLLLTLLLDVRAGLREDLRLLATSATVAADRLAALLGPDAAPAPVVTAEVRAHPVRVVHQPPSRQERVEPCVARAVRSALATQDGDVLAFLPGVGEIGRVRALLRDLSERDGGGNGGVEVVALHGGLSGAEQDAALRPSTRRRVVLATALAESSLTVPGVRVVVDSGLARVPRVDHRRGLSGLATVRVSAAVAEQRAGRAGREAAGYAIRCWPEHEHSTLAPYPDPEIAGAELTRLALELACWGTPDGAALRWWDPPPAGPLAAGRAVLRTLGAVDDDGAVTERGRRMAELGLHPRLARALLDGAREVGPRCAADVVALLDHGASGDVEQALRGLADGSDPATRRLREDAARLRGQLGTPSGQERSGQHRHGRRDPALVVALAHPERLARRRGAGSRVYLMASGTAAESPEGSPLADAEWLAVAEATRDPGRAHALIRLAARADAELAVTAAEALLSVRDEVGWVDGDVRARRVRRLGAIELEARPLADPEPRAVRAAVLDGLRSESLAPLTWSRGAEQLRARLAFLHRALGEPWPSVDDEALLAAAEVWLEPELSAAGRRADLARIPVADALRRLLPWSQAARLDELAPERITVPSGSRIALDYTAERPVLAVKLQETFGWRTTPRVAGGAVPVVLHLLSPAGRPAAVTGDLESFWHTGYPRVRAELRGRYPKHPWPEDPLTAAPTARTTRRPRA